jgi:hypothetical protein
MITLACQGLSTNANCTHSTGFSPGGMVLTYTDCDDLLGTPGDATTYSQNMAQKAADAFFQFQLITQRPLPIKIAPTNTNGEQVGCTVGPLQISVTGLELALQLDPTDFEIIVWTYGNLSATPVGGDPRVAGHVIDLLTSDPNALVPCPSTTSPTWT